MSRHKQPQVLKIDPPTELKFKGPFKDVVTSQLVLSNPTDRKIYFKVKTTAPRRYCVRPNSGFVEPSLKVNVSVMLQPFDSDPNELTKHKFMVQTMYAPEVVEDMETMWKEAQPSDLMDSKLKCVFEQPEVEVISAEHAKQESEDSAGLQQIAAAVADNTGSELQSIMEECRRLQSENAKLKHQNEELQGNTPSSGQGSDVLSQQKRLILIFLLIAFATGITLGYIMS